MEHLLDVLGDGVALSLAGALTGLFFGVAAQRSQFCLRAATVELSEGRAGPRLAVWLIAFFSAVMGVQGAVAAGWLSLDAARQIGTTGSLSGALIGGTMFGFGMILARGCASRLLVLASTGNLRALVTGLVVTLIAQSALRGVLSPARTWVAGLWTVEGGASRDLLALTGITPAAAAALSALALGAVMILSARRFGLGAAHLLGGIGVGLAVALGWTLTFSIAENSFEIVQVSSVTFTGPSTDTLMALVSTPSVVLTFGIGLVPGVALGAGGAAVIAGEWRIQRFGADTPMERYLVGAVLMGFGAMLAGGCAVGAGLSGGSALSLTAWLAVASMWISAMVTHRLMQAAAHGSRAAA